MTTTQQEPQQKPIDPKEMIEKFSVEELNHYSNEYYKKLLLPEFQLGKPFSTSVDAAQLLVRLGLILENLRVGPGSRVLDFGAGTCWLTKSLWQMGCHVVGVDVSEEALRLGRSLFEDYPVPLQPSGTWDLKLFDGHILPLEDNSVDRIICYDTFHHVPNPEAVAKEFFRVLADGGVIALNEPLGLHSQTEASQREMLDYNVLENDLHIDELVQLFTESGFGQPRLKVVPSPKFTLNLDEWKSARREESSKNLDIAIANFAQGCGIIFFEKGDSRYDSRQTDGLKHRLKIDQNHLVSKVNTPVWCKIEVENLGNAVWLHGTAAQTGIVNIGTQFVEADSKSYIAEHARFHFERDIQPGEKMEMTVPIMFSQPGQHTIRLDLVSELVCWFHDLGAEPIFITAEITD